MASSSEEAAGRIRGPGERLRVFVSSTLGELGDERAAVRRAVESLHLVPVMFEEGARPHPPREVFASYLAGSDVFVGVYAESYGWVGPGMEVSGLEEELRLAAGLPRLLYVREPVPGRDPRLLAMLAGVEAAGEVSYRRFATADELERLVADDLALLVSERFGVTPGRVFLAGDGEPGEAVGRFGGRPGPAVADGFIAVFPSAAAAIACAAEAGERAGLEMLGPLGERRAVRRALALRDLAHPGQVLFTAGVRDAAADRLSGDLRVVPAGEVRWDGRNEPVFQAASRDQPVGPPLRVGNVPEPLTSFVGRVPELDGLQEALGSHRLVTLTGLGGTGKSRLAVEVGRRRRGTVWWVDLSPLTDPGLVVAAVGSALGVGEVRGMSLAETVVAALGDDPALVVLDNCEHVLAGAVTATRLLLGRCAGVTLLATSRGPLGVEGEVIVPLAPLPVPSEGEADPGRFDAVRLFVERAALVRPGFEPDGGGTVAEICRRVDGIPLAVELAAARARILSPGEILAGLSDRFRMLAGGARGATPRHETLRASLDWSHELLSSGERILFRRLAVFPAGFDLAAAVGIGAEGGEDLLEVLDRLTGLVDQSLLTVMPDGESRFRMLETVRAYAAEKLAAAGEEAAIRDRHLSFVRDLVEGWELLARWDPRPLVKAFAEEENIRTALDWAVASGRVDDGLRTAIGTLPFWMIAGRYEEGVARTRELAARGGEERLRGNALWCEAALAATHGDFADAAALAEEALGIGWALGDRRLQARALNQIGWVTAFLDPPDARRMLAASADLTDEPWLLADTLTALAWVEVNGDDLVRAETLARRALASAGDFGYQRAEAEFFLALARILRGELATARGQLAGVDPGVWANPYTDGLLAWAAGVVAVYEGRFEEARSILAVLLTGVTVPYVAALAGWVLGIVDFALGAEASAPLAVAEAWFRGSGVNADAVADCVRLRGESAMLEDLATARALLTEAVSTARESHSPWVIARTLRTLAELERAEGTGGAPRLLAEALDRCAASSAHLDAVDVVETTVGVLLDGGRAGDAAVLLGAAEAARGTMGYRRIPTAEPRYRADLAATKAALPDEEPWLRGRSLDIAAAVAYAGRALADL